MSTTLYRKYRPQSFAEVISQNHIKVTLQNEILSGKLAHAYLFAGPRGIGKTTMARILAKSLNCQNRQAGEFEPCNNCASCLEIAEGRSLDLVEIDAASNRGINEIRELREQTKYTPVKEKHKVFIIDEAHMLTNEAFNALLKTLEEPPSHAIFVLATTELHKIPETIISRCQRFDYKKIPLEDISSHLSEIARKEGIKVADNVTLNIARLSEGYLRDAVSLMGQVLALGEKEITEEEASVVIPRSDWQRVIEFVFCILGGKTKSGIQLVNQLIEEGVDPEHFTKITIETLRKLLLAKVISNWQEIAWEAGEEALPKLKQAVDKRTALELTQIMEILLEALTSLKQAVIIQLPLEIALVKIEEIIGFSEEIEDSDNDRDFNGDDSSQAEAKTEEVIKEQSEEETIESASENQVAIEEIKQKWPEVIEALKAYNNSIATFLKVATPVKVEDQKLYLGFQYKFHFERLKENKNAQIIEEVIIKIFNSRLQLEAIIDQKYSLEIDNGEEAKNEDDQEVKAVLEALGGEVI